MPIRDLAHYLTLSYPVEIRQNTEHGGFFATHPDLEGCMAEGGSAEEAIRNLADSRELWIEARLDGGYPVPEPPDEELSGRISLRMAPSLHTKLARIAERQGISLNLLLNTVLAEYAGAMTVEAPMRQLMSELREAVTQRTGSRFPAFTPSHQRVGSLSQVHVGGRDPLRARGPMAGGAWQ